MADKIDVVPAIGLGREQASGITAQGGIPLGEQLTQEGDDAGWREQKMLVDSQLHDNLAILTDEVVVGIVGHAFSGLLVVHHRLCAAVDGLPFGRKVEEGIIDGVRVGGDGIGRAVDGCAVEFHPALEDIIPVEERPHLGPRLVVDDELLQHIEHGQPMVRLIELAYEVVVVEGPFRELHEDAVSQHLGLLHEQLHLAEHHLLHPHEMLHRCLPHVVENHDAVVVLVEEVAQEYVHRHLRECVGNHGQSPLS